MITNGVAERVFTPELDAHVQIESVIPEVNNNQNLFYMLSSVSVVIPTLNEAQNLPHVLPRIPAWVQEIILVDGHSTDNTIEVARQLCPNIKIVMQEGKGKGAALRSGFAKATGDIVVMLDADGSTDPTEIPVFIGALLAGADMVKGSRFLQGGGTSDMSFHRKLGNWGFTFMVRRFFGGNYTDLCYGYAAFWRHILPQLNLDGDGFEIETMINVRALCSGLRVAEVPSFEFERIHGVSNLRVVRDGFRVLRTIVKEVAKQRSQSVQKTVINSRFPRLPMETISRQPDLELGA